jgi:hypothetical protein
MARGHNKKFFASQPPHPPRLHVNGLLWSSHQLRTRQLKQHQALQLPVAPGNPTHRLPHHSTRGHLPPKHSHIQPCVYVRVCVYARVCVRLWYINRQQHTLIPNSSQWLRNATYSLLTLFLYTTMVVWASRKLTLARNDWGVGRHVYV